MWFQGLGKAEATACQGLSAFLAALLQSTPSIVPSAGADVVAPMGTSTMPPFWLEQGHALWIIDELKRRRQGGGAPRWLNFDSGLFRTASSTLSEKLCTHLKYEISRNERFPSPSPRPPRGICCSLSLPLADTGRNRCRNRYRNRCNR